MNIKEAKYWKGRYDREPYAIEETSHESMIMRSCGYLEHHEKTKPLVEALEKILGSYGDVEKPWDTAKEALSEYKKSVGE